jgi:SAM-dependent methyltransferase
MSRRRADAVLFQPCAGRAEFAEYLRSQEALFGELAKRESTLARGAVSFTFPGWCAVCDRKTEFLVDHQHALPGPEGGRVPNWRERQVCSGCGLNSRMRASLEFLRDRARATSRDLIYLTEQSTPMYRAVAGRFPLTLGSEYLRDRTPPGQVNAQNLRCEDVTRLSFADCSFDYILSFDVLEHVPDYHRALDEFFRCLRPEGTLVLSVPFDLAAEETLVRARVGKDGNIEHLLPAEYHGDPMSSEGALCFYHFGWSLLAELRSAGWRSVALHLYASAERGYLGGPQFLIAARRPPPFGGSLFDGVAEVPVEEPGATVAR